MKWSLIQNSMNSDEAKWSIWLYKKSYNIIKLKQEWDFIPQFKQTFVPSLVSFVSVVNKSLNQWESLFWNSLGSGIEKETDIGRGF